MKREGPQARAAKVRIFNLKFNLNRITKFRLIDSGASPKAASLSGVDEAGNASLGTGLTFNISSGSVKEITASELENDRSESSLDGSNRKRKVSGD